MISGAPASSSQLDRDQLANRVTDGVKALGLDDRPKAKRKNIDVLAEYQKVKNKNTANFIVIGE